MEFSHNLRRITTVLLEMAAGGEPLPVVLDLQKLRDECIRFTPEELEFLNEGGAVSFRYLPVIPAMRALARFFREDP